MSESTSLETGLPGCVVGGDVFCGGADRDPTEVEDVRRTSETTDVFTPRTTDLLLVDTTLGFRYKHNGSTRLF